MKTKKERKTNPMSLHNESGVIIVVVALLLVVFLGVVALAVDIGHIMTVRNELQNAADTTALAGASQLFDESPVAGVTYPNWTAAETKATQSIGLNKSDGTTLTDCTVQTGYWNTAHPEYGLQSKGITLTSDDYPAVEVTVSRITGKNSGAVKNWFAQVLGISYSNVTRTATAAMISPCTAKAGTLLPIVVHVDLAEDKSTYTCPATFRIGSGYHYGDNEAGQWSSFDVTNNSASYTRSLITNGNPIELSIGDYIYIQPGTQTSLYAEIPVGADVILPIVPSLTPKTWQQIEDFLCFHITASVGGSGKYIEGCINDSCYSGNTNPGNCTTAQYGVYAPPRLVN